VKTPNGLTASFTALEPRELARRVAAGQCDLYLGQLVAPSPDALHEYAAAFAAGGDRWPVKKLEDGKLTLEAAAAAFAERLPVVPLFHRAVRAHHRTIVRGVGFDALGRIAFADLYLFAAPAGGGDGGP